MIKQDILKRRCDRNNYRVVAEVKNNGTATFFVEFQTPLITFNSCLFPQFNFFGRWEPVYEFINHETAIVNGSLTPTKIHVGKKIGWNKISRDCKEDAYIAIEQELQRKQIQYGNEIKKRKVV